jgi:hypothetical protein
MELREERLKFKYDAANVDRYVDRMIEVLKEAGADQVAYMAIDMVFRSFLQWLHSAQLQNADADMVRNSTVHLMNVMLIELMGRMNSNVDGKQLSAREWAQDFLVDLSGEIAQDLSDIEKAKSTMITRQ